MTKKLLDSAGRAQTTLAPRSIGPHPITKFARTPTTKICNSSSKGVYKTPVWPSARVSQSDSIKSRGV